MVNCPDRAVTARMAYAQNEESDEPYWSIGMDGTVDLVDPGKMDSQEDKDDLVESQGNVEMTQELPGKEA